MYIIIDKESIVVDTFSNPDNMLDMSDEEKQNVKQVPDTAEHLIGKRYISETGTFEDVEPDFPVEPVVYQPSTAEIAQMISDLQADLIIAGVI